MVYTIIYFVHTSYSDHDKGLVYSYKMCYTALIITYCISLLFSTDYSGMRQYDRVTCPKHVLCKIRLLFAHPRDPSST